MDRWETKLATRDTNRVVRPFDWGLEWLDGAVRNGDPRRHLLDYVSRHGFRLFAWWRLAVGTVGLAALYIWG